MEAKHGIEIINPFYDLPRLEHVDIEKAAEYRYSPDEATQLIENDTQAILDSDGIIAVVDGAPSIGTIMEIVYAHFFGRPRYVYAPGAAQQHPWILHHATQIVTSLDEMDNLLTQIA